MREQPNLIPNLVSFASVYGGLMRRIEREAGRVGVGPAEGRVLTALSQCAMSPAQLSKALPLDDGQTSRLIDSLCKKTLAERVAREPRGVTVALTDAGFQAAAEVTRRQVRCAEFAWSTMGPQRQERFLDTAAALWRHLGNFKDPATEIRDATPGEVSILVQEAVVEFVNGAYGYSADLEKDCFATLARAFESRRFALVVDRLGVVEGGVVVTLNPPKETGTIVFFAMFASRQGQGFGTKMIERAISRAKSLGIRRLEVEWPYSGRGSTYFSKRGWKLRSTRPRVWGGKDQEWAAWTLAL